MKSPPLSEQKPSRKFFCDFPNCGKSFTRAEHLQRHELNHRDSPNTCRRCSAHFARQDLLGLDCPKTERHMERHAQKDKEAGGEGLGVLVTRKRCWRDENGNITTKRPASSVAAIGKALEARRQRRGDSSDEGGSGSGMENAGVSMSLPYSSRSSRSSSRNRRNIRGESVMSDVSFGQFQNEQQLGMQNILGDGFLTPAPSLQLEHHLNHTMPDVTAAVVGGTLASCQAEINGYFNINTAESFNMPFNTLNSYNWGFEELGILGTGQENLGVSFDQSIVMDTNPLTTGVYMEPVYYCENQLLPIPTNEQDYPNFQA